MMELLQYAMLYAHHEEQMRAAERERRALPIRPELARAPGKKPGRLRLPALLLRRPRTV